MYNTSSLHAYCEVINWLLMIIKELNEANVTIKSLNEELEMRERLYQDLRETKDKELTAMRKMNCDIEVSEFMRVGGA